MTQRCIDTNKGAYFRTCTERKKGREKYKARAKNKRIQFVMNFCNILFLCLIANAMPLVCVLSFLLSVILEGSSSTGLSRLCIVDDNKSSSQSNRIKSNAIHWWSHTHMHTSSRSQNENDLINLIENFDDPKLSGGDGGRVASSLGSVGGSWYWCGAMLFMSYSRARALASSIVGILVALDPTPSIEARRTK